MFNCLNLNEMYGQSPTQVILQLGLLPLPCEIHRLRKGQW